MPENYLFEYAVIRVVPRVEREEFVNVGVVLFCSKLKFLEVMFKLDEDRLKAIHKDVDISELEENLKAIQRICAGSTEGGPIAKLDMASRFRWLTATRSTILQASKVHPGFCADPGKALDRLFVQQVL